MFLKLKLGLKTTTVHYFCMTTLSEGQKETDLPEVDKDSTEIESSREVLNGVCQKERHAHQELQREN